MAQTKTEASFRPGYHDLLRPEILALVPEGAKRVLDLGCGSGKLGKAIKQRQECTVIGVELNKGAAAVAEKNLDAVQVADVEKWKPPAKTKSFDCIVCADILEHLYNPWAILRRIKDHLTPNGTVVASIPNIAHPAVINQLKSGLFLYQPAGILDFTHCRFFTRTTIFQMFATANLKIKTVTSHPSPTNPQQYLITAKKVRVGGFPPLATIIVLTCNGLGYLEKCIESIRKYTRPPHKIIVVDNGSADGTQDWLRKQDDILSIEAQQNLGFPVGNNLGIECADTPFFVIANNDIVVTDGWLARLIDTMTENPKTGIVGPISNYVSGPQLDQDAKYKTLRGMELYAAGIKTQNEGKIEQFHRIVFFCVLIKSELARKIGLLDPRFGLGNFDDDDYCLRAVKAGYKCKIDRSVFIHHYGSKYYQTLGPGYEALLKRNLEIFKQKWGFGAR